MHFYDKGKDADKLANMVGKGNAIAEQINKKDDKHRKYEVFEAIDFLANSARSLYCDEDMSWDDVVSNLVEAIGKLKGKEKKLVDMAGKDNETTGQGVPVHD